MSKRIGRWCVVWSALGTMACAGGCTPTGNGDAAAVAPPPAAGDRGALAAPPAPPQAAPGVPVAPALNPVIAMLDDRVVTRDDFLKALIESHGYNTLMALVRLEAAKSIAANRKAVVTPADVQAERDNTLAKLFHENDEKVDEQIDQAKRIAATTPEQTEKKREKIEKLTKQKESERRLLLAQFLEQQRITPGEFELFLETNAYLRKVAEPQIRAGITEVMLRKEYEVAYNEKVRARHVQVSSAKDYIEARRRVEAGEPFATVVQSMSTNRQSAALNGELPAFSRQDERFPQNFKDVTFALRPMELSAMIDTGDGSYHLVQMLERVPPRGTKFEEVKDVLEANLIEKATAAGMRELSEQIGVYAREKLKIDDPILSAQFRAKAEEFRKAQADARERYESDLKARGQRVGPQTGPAATTAPAVVPPAGPGRGVAPAFGGPATQPVTQPAAPATTHPAAAAPAPRTAPAAAAATRPAGATTRPAGSPN